MEQLDDAVFGREDGAVREPGGKKNRDGARNDKSSCDQSLFPGFRFDVQQVKFGGASQSGKERRRSIVNFQQAEAVGGGAERGFFFGGRVDEVVEVVLAEVALGGLDGGAGEEADHFVEKAVAGEGDEVAVIERGEVGTGDLADVVGLGGFVAPVGGKGAEVVRALEDGQGFGEIIGVELAGEVPGAMGEERRQDGGEAEAVGVGLGNGGEAGVEVIGHLFAFNDADFGRELGVEGWNPVEGVHGEAVRCVEVGDLAEGVHAGVGATASVEAKGFLGDGGEGLFDQFLNGLGIGLDLPTAKAGAVIGDSEFEMHEDKRGASAGARLSDLRCFGKSPGY